MAILGSIVKSAIELKNNLGSNSEDPVSLQEKQLKNLLEKAANTAFGKYYGFSQLLKEEDVISAFQRRVPIFDYHEMNEKWWSQQQKLPDITWPGKPDFFALSSGTTGKDSKRIPVTKEMLESIRSVGISQAESMANFDLPAEFFEKEILMLSSSANLSRHEYGHLEGEISGINTNNLPSWFGGFYRPGEEIAKIDNWEDRIAAIAKAAPEWDIGAIAGIPSWVQMMLKAIIDEHQLANIHEIWPGLAVYATGGVAFEPYRERFDKLMGKPVNYVDTYLASEGFIAHNTRPDTMSMKLACNHSLFFEFVPFDERGFDETGNMLADPEVFSIRDVKEGEEYALLLSTPAGAWRYLIGDTIKFTDLEQLEIKISGRTKYFLNVVGAQLSEEKINDGITAVARKLEGITIEEFGVAALKDDQGAFYHQWVMGIEGNQVDEQHIADLLDAELKERNKNYGVARSKALKGIKVAAIPPALIYGWLEQEKKKGGQVKFPKVMKADRMESLLEFAKSKVA
jgi:SOS-response transcriptional repressor LexA